MGWENAKTLRQEANNWNNRMSVENTLATVKSIDESIIYEPTEFKTKDDTKIFVVQDVSQAAIFKTKLEGKMAVLNFASYKKPGGGYIDGAMAQEESLCHCSNLYQIISDDKFKTDFYEHNKKNLNNGLYDSRIIYSPDVVFYNKDKTKTKLCDVITSAAPNKTAIVKYNKNIDNYYIEQAMKDRILNILNVAMKNKVDILILGAFGCGVFGNDILSTARIFKECLTSYHYYRNMFKLVLFPIPDASTCNIFKEVMESNI